jgi:nicotinamidase-related amidase
MLHEWAIEQREYERHEARRGKRHAFECLEATRTALIVIDMVPFFATQNPYCRGIVPSIQSLAQATRSAGGIVAWILPAATDGVCGARVEFLGLRVAERYNRSGGDGPLEGRLWHEFDVADRDLLAEKSAASAFFPGSCELHEMLEQREIETVLIAGTVANVCCESTARDASQLGYRTIMVADANAARRDQDLNATLHTIYRSFGDVRPTSEIIALLHSDTTHPPHPTRSRELSRVRRP